MKEITVTYTAEVTRVYHLSDFYAEDFAKTMQKRGGQKVAALLKHEMAADDVHVRDLKVFEMDGA